MTCRTHRQYTAWEQMLAWPICWSTVWWLGVWLPWVRAKAAGLG